MNQIFKLEKHNRREAYLCALAIFNCYETKKNVDILVMLKI